jgi:hypothetical protein
MQTFNSTYKYKFNFLSYKNENEKFKVNLK